MNTPPITQSRRSRANASCLFDNFPQETNQRANVRHNPNPRRKQAKPQQIKKKHSSVPRTVAVRRENEREQLVGPCRVRRIRLLQLVLQRNKPPPIVSCLAQRTPWKTRTTQKTPRSQASSLCTPPVLPCLPNCGERRSSTRRIVTVTRCDPFPNSVYASSYDTDRRPPLPVIGR